MKRLTLPLLLACAALWADRRTNPPTVQDVAPLALTRGLTTDLVVKGINLAGAREVVFDNPGVRGRVVYVNTAGKFTGRFIGSNGTPSTIERGDPAPMHEVGLEIEVDAGASLDLASFRLIAEAGSTEPRALSIEPFYGARPEMEPNDDLADALLQPDYIFPPAIVAGAIDKPGDVDILPFRALAGEETVFHVTAGQIGSRLRWRLDLLNEEGVTLASRSMLEEGLAPALSYRIPADGRYFLTIRDLDSGGGKGHFYRLRIGAFPMLTGVEPLGVREGAESEVAVRGYNLGELRTARVEGQATYRQASVADLRLEAEAGETHNRLMLAVGRHPEIAERELGSSPDGAMELAAPVTVNGRISGFADAEARRADEDFFRFRAKKGEQYVVEVEARRLGSPLDSVVEVLDAEGRPIPRATVRAEFASRLVLNDRNSSQAGLRVEDVEHYRVGDWVMVGNEILRVAEEPRGPDSDYFFDSFDGQRIGYFDTTPEAHAVDTPVYKVSLHPPMTRFPPNGLPVRQLFYRNDDGGPGYGKDSRLSFTAPADGEYLIRLRDLRGRQGEDFAYRLTLRVPEPDFRLALSPANANVPRGGAAAISVDARRIDGFDGPVRVVVRDLPKGFSASEGIVMPGETSTVVVIAAAADAELERAAPLIVEGRAEIDGRTVAHEASPDDGLRVVALAGEPDIWIELEDEAATLPAGGTVDLAVRIRRREGFTGRVPVTAMNLPRGVKVANIGLNGILVRPDETRRVFTLAAEEWVEPQEREMTVSGVVETRSPLRAGYAARPIPLRIAPSANKTSAGAMAPGAAGSAGR